MAGTMNISFRGLRALVSALLLGAGLTAYAARLDPISKHITPPGLSDTGDINPADGCSMPCIRPHDGAGESHDLR